MITTQQDTMTKQVIYGTVPSKSNCMKIITFKNKDKSKEHSSLGKTKYFRLMKSLSTCNATSTGIEI